MDTVLSNQVRSSLIMSINFLENVGQWTDSDNSNAVCIRLQIIIA